MTRSVVAAAAVLAMALPGWSASQQSLPQLKAGLWRITVGMPAAPAMHSQLCVAGPLTPEQLLGRPRRPSGDTDCTTIRHQRTADELVDESRCGSPGHGFHTIMTFKISQTHLQGTAVSELDGHPAETVQQTWDWVGSCPAGMETGKMMAEPRSAR